MAIFFRTGTTCANPRHGDDPIKKARKKAVARLRG